MRKFPIKRIGRKQKGKIPNQEKWEKAKKEREFPIKDRKRTDEICRKVLDKYNIRTIQICHQVNKKRKETMT